MKNEPISRQEFFRRLARSPAAIACYALLGLRLAGLLWGERHDLRQFVNLAFVTCLALLLVGVLPALFGFGLQLLIRKPVPCVIHWLVAAAFSIAAVAFRGLPNVHIDTETPLWASWTAAAAGFLVLGSFLRSGAILCRDVFPRRFSHDIPMPKR